MIFYGAPCTCMLIIIISSSSINVYFPCKHGSDGCSTLVGIGAEIFTAGCSSRCQPPFSCLLRHTEGTVTLFYPHVTELLPNDISRGRTAGHSLTSYPGH